MSFCRKVAGAVQGRTDCGAEDAKSAKVFVFDYHVLFFAPFASLRQMII